MVTGFQSPRLSSPSPHRAGGGGGEGVWSPCDHVIHVVECTCSVVEF